jgi:putative acetyltransferase
MIRLARAEEMPIVRALFEEYQQHLGIDLCFQSFASELTSLPGNYVAIWLLEQRGEPVGVVALRPSADGVGEMKRLYIRPSAQGQGWGRQLVDVVIAAARDHGFVSLRLDTLPSMGAAIGLYRNRGFQEIAPYTNNPVPGALFFELRLV